MKNNELALKLAEIGQSLVSIASAMAENVEPQEVEPVKKQHGRKKKQQVVEVAETPKNKIPTAKPRKRKIGDGSRVNTWVDDGTLFADLKGKTPPAQPKPKRASGLVQVRCSVCGKTEKKHRDTIYSVSYRCDNCVLEGKVRG